MCVWVSISQACAVSRVSATSKITSDFNDVCAVMLRLNHEANGVSECTAKCSKPAQCLQYGCIRRPLSGHKVSLKRI